MRYALVTIGGMCTGAAVPQFLFNNFGPGAALATIGFMALIYWAVLLTTDIK